MSEPEKKLYRVEVTHVVYVMASDRRDAGFLAERSLENEGPEETFANEVEHPDQVDKEWREARPYGCDDDRTCVQIAEAQMPPPPPYEDPNQRKLFS